MRNMVPKQNYDQLQRRYNELGQLVSAYQNQVQQNERLQGQLIQNKGQVAILETEKGNMVRKSLYDEVVRKNAKLQRYLDECKSPTIDPNENATSLANKLLGAKEKLCDRYKACSSNNCLQALQIAGSLCGRPSQSKTKQHQIISLLLGRIHDDKEKRSFFFRKKKVAIRKVLLYFILLVLATIIAMHATPMAIRIIGNHGIFAGGAAASWSWTAGEGMASSCFFCSTNCSFSSCINISSSSSSCPNIVGAVGSTARTWLLVLCCASSGAPTDG